MKKQEDAGAEYLDCNTALTDADELQSMLWLVGLAQEHTACGIMLDSPNPDVIAQCLRRIQNRKTIVNSITLDATYDALIETAKQCGAGLVCLPMRGNSIPQTAGERLDRARDLIEKLRRAGIPDENIYLDVLAEAIATNANAARTALETIRLLRESFPAAHTLCGLSNVSFGLPRRAKLNSAFLAMAMHSGLDSVIADITSPHIKDTLHAANALLGQDAYCMEYITYSRGQA